MWEGREGGEGQAQGSQLGRHRGERVGAGTLLPLPLPLPLPPPPPLLLLLQQPTPLFAGMQSPRLLQCPTASLTG